MDKFDLARELMAEATALLEDACEAAVGGQGAASPAAVHHAAGQVIDLARNAIVAAEQAQRLFPE